MTYPAYRLALPAAMKAGLSRFDRESALFCARLSALVYDQEWILGLSAAAGGVQSTFLTMGTTQAVVLVWPEAAVVVFRGTERNYEDILTDLKFRREDRTVGSHRYAGTVHRGFREAYALVHEDLAACLSGLSRPVYLAGHSLGGALSVLALGELRSPAMELAAAYTFGAPRVGDSEFAADFDRDSPAHWRIERGADIVPMLPLLLMGYRHGGKRVYLPAHGPLRDGWPAWRVWIDRSVRIAKASLTASGWRRFVPEVLYLDHRIADYASALDGGGT